MSWVGYHRLQCENLLFRICTTEKNVCFSELFITISTLYCWVVVLFCKIVELTLEFKKIGREREREIILFTFSWNVFILARPTSISNSFYQRHLDKHSFEFWWYYMTVPTCRCKKIWEAAAAVPLFSIKLHLVRMLLLAHVRDQYWCWSVSHS